MTMNGTYTPPQVILTMAASIWAAGGITATIESLDAYAGAAPGSAVLAFRTRYARDAQLTIGGEASVTIGGSVVFHGTVAQGDYLLGPDDDLLTVVLQDDKWGMRANTIGQIGIGTVAAGAAGFTDVGFAVIFNKDGRSNRDANAATRDFCTGTGAIDWTIKEMIQFVFDQYIPATVATLDPNQLGTAYDATPRHVNLVGKTGLDAVDHLVKLAGESWCLRPGTSKSEFRAVKPNGGTGSTSYSISLFEPGAAAKVISADDRSASNVHISTGMTNIQDVFQAVSAPIVIESVHTSTGADPMLVRNANFKHKEYLVQFKVDVTQYAANNLGLDLSVGSRPKVWRSQLVTRLNATASGYLAAPGSVPATSLDAPTPEIPVWISIDGTEANAKLCTGGYKIDHEHGTIDFKSEVDVRKDGTTDGSDKLSLVDTSGAYIAAIGIWVTVATVMTLPESKESTEQNKFLPTHFCRVIEKTDLVPERRRNSWLPDLAGNNNAITKLSAASEEKYIDVGATLQAIVDSAVANSPTLERSIKADFEMLPIWHIGEKVVITGRVVGASGHEVVTEYHYNLDDMKVSITAQDVMAGIDHEDVIAASN